MRENLVSKLRNLFILGLLFLGCTYHPHVLSKSDSISRLQKDLDLILSEPSLSQAQYGIVIKSLATDEIIYFHNGHKAFVPASNLKLFTAAVALLQLGPQYQFQTDLYKVGEFAQNGIWHGDIILAGTGDPTLGSNVFSNNSLAVFESFSDSLKKNGINKIAGRIIGDDSFFDDEPLGAGWAWDYQSDCYAAQISALSFNENCLNLVINPAHSGTTVEITTNPLTDYIQITNNLTTIDAAKTKIDVHRLRMKNRVICNGHIARSDTSVTAAVTIENPTRFAAHILKEVLTRRGIPVDSDAVDIDDLKNYRFNRETASLIARQKSPQLQEIITTTLKESKNLYAELLLRAVGKEKFGVGNAAAGVTALYQTLTTMGIDTTQISLVDGSGLSRKDFVTPMSIVTLLTFINRHPFAKIFYDALPIAGVDGTLKKRMIGTAAAGNVHAKTGTLDFVKALSGYEKSKDNEEFAFSILINNYTVSHSIANRIQDSICQRLANFIR